MNLAQKLLYSCLLSLVISPLALAETYQCPKRSQVVQNGQITIPQGWVSAPESAGEKIHGRLNFTSVELATSPGKDKVSCTYQGRNEGTLLLEASYPGAQGLTKGFEKYWDSPSVCRSTNPANCQWAIQAKK